ncbi:MAG: tRNA (adenosine(37)-N6)-threonylcarbamoyltransferase complex dimerization subunit type 1 TsaB [Chloroflexota bacterium]
MLLAIDTSTAHMGLALFDGSQVIGEMYWLSRQHHTIELAPSVFELLKRTSLGMDDLKALGVAIGPGSFTSLRVGLAFVKGLALARRLPVFGVPTLDVVAAAQEVRDLPLAAVLQAGRGRLALAWYKVVEGAWQAQGEPQVTTVDELAEGIHSPTIVCGELIAEERQRLARKRVNVQLASPAQCVRRPAMLAELAWKRYSPATFGQFAGMTQAEAGDDASTLAPIYLHVANPIPP